MTNALRRLLLTSAVSIAGLSGCVPTPTDGDSGPAPHLRQVRWGMSPEEVRQKEPTAPKSDSGDRLQFNARVFGERAGLTYVFTQGGLSHAWYSFFVRYSEEIPAFDRLKTALTEAHGEPLREEQVWGPSVKDRERLQEALETNRRGYKDVTWMPWSERIKSGDLALTAEWETEETVLRLRLYGRNGVVLFRLVYRDRGRPPLPESR